MRSKEAATMPLQPGVYYHLYNRGNNGENLFREERNYRYFMQLYAQHIYPAAETFAYCLMRNHFHFLVRIRSEQEYRTEMNKVQDADPDAVFSPSKKFSNLFNAYTKAINKAYGRTGSLFQECFHRIVVSSDAYFLNLIFYIHYNPQKHGFVSDFREWNWSSYDALLTAQSTKIQRAAVLDWFGGVNQFKTFHDGRVDELAISVLVADDKD